jgi:hypothetical protein
MDDDIIDISSDWAASGKTNFGGGVELLMNDRKKESNANIDIEDLNNLESELNDLANINTSGFSLPVFANTDSLYEKPSVKFSDSSSSSGVGAATAESTKDNKTWDGYGKFNNIPVNPDQSGPSGPPLNKDEMLREKFKFLRKLEALEKKGVDLTKKYTMESPLAEMQGEYEMIMEEKSRQNSVKFQGNMMMAIINGIEFLNDKFDPFDIKLDGWGEQINENINDYDDIFGELHDKYKSKATMAPELKLLFQLGGSAMMVHMTNTMFKSAMPGMDDILRQNPDLMNQFQQAAVNSLHTTNPGFSGFMNGLMTEPKTNNGPPPPIATQNLNPPSRQGNNSYDSKIQMGRNNFTDDGINMKETKRPEMKGPSDINDILSGLKPKTINIQPISGVEDMNNSTISISDLKDLQDGNVPKRSKKRTNKSDKNTISLDI